jgi:hypothetical protein
MTDVLETLVDDPVPEASSAPRRVPQRLLAPNLWKSVASFAAVTALCAWMGFYAMFNSFAGWDDEGGLLSVLDSFAHHGGLYTHIDSPFGPFYFEVFAAPFSWLPLNLDIGRLSTLGITLLISLGFGVAIKMLTRSVTAGVATQAGTFMLLILSFQVESLHPTLVVSLLFATALIALALVARGQRSLGFMLLGATVAALILTIVNVGIFAAIAFLFTGLVLSPPVRRMRIPRLAGAALFIATPFLLVLVGGHAADSWNYYWVFKYEVIVALSAAGIVVVTLNRGDLQGLVRSRDAYRFLVGGGVLTALVIVIALLTGTHPLDLIRGVLLDPARFGNSTSPLLQSGFTEVWGALCLIGAIFYRRHLNRNAPAPFFLAWVHVVAGILILYFALLLASTSPHSPAMFLIALPLLFFAAIPPAGTTDAERIARVGVVAFAVLEALVAYPLAGTQVRWSQLLIVPAGILCLYDGIHQLHPSLAVMRRLGRQALSSLLALVVVLAGLGWLALVWHRDLWAERHKYWENSSLTLPGSHLIRIPSNEVKTLSAITNAIRSQCSTFVSEPALNSFYFWTGEQPPKDDWLNVWFYSADSTLQTQVAHQIETHDRTRFCVLDNPRWWSGWAQGYQVPQLPLTRLVERFKQQNKPAQRFKREPGPTLFTWNNGYQLFVSHKK